MKEITIAGKKIEIYDDIETLPIVRFHKYNKMILVESGIGSDLNSADGHIQKAMIYASGKEPHLAVTELNLLRQNLYLMMEDINPRTLTFATLVKSIDGVEQTDLSDDALKKVSKVFDSMPLGDFNEVSETVKKKIDDLLVLYFPKYFDNAEVKQYHADLLRRTQLMLLNIINDNDDNGAEIQRITDELMVFSKPAVFTGAESIEIQHDKSFENMCLAIAQHVNVDVKNYSVLQFYNANEYMTTMLKAQAYELKK